MSTQRQERVNELVREELSRIIQFGMKDPRLGLVSLTGVRVTADLRQARVYVSVYGDQAAQEQALAALTGAAGFLRRELGKAIRLRHLPELEFELDHSLEQGARIFELLEQVKDANSVDEENRPRDQSPDSEASQLPDRDPCSS